MRAATVSSVRESFFHFLLRRPRGLRAASAGVGQKVDDDAMVEKVERKRECFFPSHSAEVSVQYQPKPEQNGSK